jgi:hypothetical protein
MYLATLDPEGPGHEHHANASPVALRIVAAAVFTSRQEEARFAASASGVGASSVTSVSDMEASSIARIGG